MLHKQSPPARAECFVCVVPDRASERIKNTFAGGLKIIFMGKYWQYYASYSIWSQISPPIGKEQLHCDRQRGYNRAKKQELNIKHLATLDNNFQRIGLLAQRGVYEFQRNVQLLSEYNGVEKVAEKLNLYQELPEIREKIELILNNYYHKPILVEKNIVELSRGDESFPRTRRYYSYFRFQNGQKRFRSASSLCISSSS